MGVDYTEIGKRIRAARKAKGLSQEKLAELIEVSVPHMSNIETGKTQFSLLLLVELVVALDVTADSLLFGQDNDLATVHRLALEEVGEIFEGCTKLQALLLRDMARNAKEDAVQRGSESEGTEQEGTEQEGGSHHGE